MRPLFFFFFFFVFIIFVFVIGRDNWLGWGGICFLVNFIFLSFLVVFVLEYDSGLAGAALDVGEAFGLVEVGGKRRMHILPG